MLAREALSYSDSWLPQAYFPLIPPHFFIFLIKCQHPPGHPHLPTLPHKVSPKLPSSLDYKDLPWHIPMGHILNSRSWLSLWCPNVRNPPQELGVFICRDAVQPQRASAWQDANEICTTRMPLNLESLITQDFIHWKLFGSIIYINSHVTIWAHLSP